MSLPNKNFRNIRLKAAGTRQRRENMPIFSYDTKTDKTSRDKLLEATMQLLGSSCLHSISIRDIAKAANVNSALVSYYFGSKELLYEAILQEQFENFKKVAGEVLSTEGDIRENFITAFSAIADFHFTHPHWLKLYFRETSNPSPGYYRFVQPCIAYTMDRIINMIKVGAGQGVFRSDIQPVHVAQSFFGILCSCFMQNQLPDRSYGLSADIVTHLSFSQQMLLQQTLAPASTGSKTVNVVPTPTSLTTYNRPPMLLYTVIAD